NLMPLPATTHTLPHAQNVALPGISDGTTKGRGRIFHTSCVQHSCLQRASGTVFETYFGTSRSERASLTSLPMVGRLLFYPFRVKAKAENNGFRGFRSVARDIMLRF